MSIITPQDNKIPVITSDMATIKSVNTLTVL